MRHKNSGAPTYRPAVKLSGAHWNTCPHTSTHLVWMEGVPGDDGGAADPRETSPLASDLPAGTGTSRLSHKS
ncbi:hypothetical protein E2C01_044796 [Portunus trituberculatus]|uniref:Uncharacterized protein n=1 Tax=Portunus trituberculatus TaxID=210409 RepID=A0A5B7FU08_PORTR|nr:hypothetical protein [Portunus trituberculatus]